MTDMALMLWIFGLFFAHFIGDFVFQSDAMAKNKNHDTVALIEHVGCYTLPLMFFCLVLEISGSGSLGPLKIILFVGFNVLAHFMVDYVTSRASKLEFERKDYHRAFVIIGMDQMIHMMCLIWSFFWLVKL